MRSAKWLYVGALSKISCTVLSTRRRLHEMMRACQLHDPVRQLAPAISDCSTRWRLCTEYSDVTCGELGKVASFQSAAISQFRLRVSSYTSARFLKHFRLQKSLEKPGIVLEPWLSDYFAMMAGEVRCQWRMTWSNLQRSTKDFPAAGSGSPQGGWLLNCN
jgi:hypothetical protein